MKPYNIEIFDRHYNFRSNALIDPSGFSFAFDALSVDKSTVTIPKGQITIREQAESGSTSDNTVSSSDYIRILSDNNEYVGVIVNVEEGDIYTTLTYEPLHSLLNHEVIIVADDIKHTNIEAYIQLLITQEFISNSDTYQNIPNLSVTTTSSTTGIMDYNDTNEVYVIINILNDLIYPAFREYLIRTNISIDFTAKTLNISIGEISDSAVTVEADLPNVTAKNFTIRKASSMVNKLSLFDTKNYSLAEYDFYLHPSDYSFDQINNSDRFFPVVNQVGNFDSDAITEDAFLETANADVRAMNKYLEIERDLSTSEKAELDTALSDFFPYIVGSKTAQEWEAYIGDIARASLNFALDLSYDNQSGPANPIRNHIDINKQVSSYDDLIEEGDGSYYWTWDIYPSYAPTTYKTFVQKQTNTGIMSTFYLFPSWSNNHHTGTDSGDVYYHTTTHANLGINVTFRLQFIEIGDYPDVTTLTITGKIYTPINNSLISQALTDYKKTDAFKQAFAAYKVQNFAAIISGYAKKVFKTSKYTNLIELTVLPDDTMVNPLSMEIGQVVNIIHDGVSYSSILSGREIQKNGLVKLVFGTIRLELTKILNMKGV